MKRFLTLMMISCLMFGLLLSGCSQTSKPQQNSQSTAQEEQPPQAEAGREDVLGADKKIVMGFYTDAEGNTPSSKESMLKHMDILDEVGFFWYSFDGAGNIKTTGKADMSIKQAAQKSGAKAYALVHNMAQGGFDANLAHQMLANRTHRANMVKNLVNMTTKYGWDGVSIDIEKAPPSDRNNFSAFINELHSALKAKDKVLNISIPAKFIDYPNDLWSGAYDYAAIGKGADQVILMTYDEHGTGTTAGPIASQSWVNRVIEFAVTKIPKEKIVMGLPVYSYDWGSNKPTLPDYLTYTQSVARAKENGVQILTDGSAKVPHYFYTAKGVRHEVYLENADSLTPKLEHAREHNLHGVAVWRLGMEDPNMWNGVVKYYGTNKNKK